MLQQLEKLCTTADGRYATDAELTFFQDYLKTVRLRFSLYQKIQKLEPQLIQQMLETLKVAAPSMVKKDDNTAMVKCRRDATFVLRFAATSLLTDDPDIFKDKAIIWLQTIMKSFKTAQNYQETYKAMQAVVKQALTPQEAELFCPLLEMLLIY